MTELRIERLEDSVVILAEDIGDINSTLESIERKFDRLSPHKALRTKAEVCTWLIAINAWVTTNVLLWQLVTTPWAMVWFNLPALIASIIYWLPEQE